MSKLNYFMGAVGAILLASCSAPPGESAFSTAPVRIPEVKSTTELLFINGKEFCSEYKEITAKEYGKYITVPKDYNDPSKGTLEIYAYTMKPFNPDLPTYIYVDGGPGQNTHGMMPDYFDDRMNEIRFDQRGLGCSTPETYELYKSAYLYSSENNVRDMDAIRHSYGIKEWSVYGVSYGTVPATMYGSKFPEQTVSVVLEGVVGRTELLTQNRYKADKLNLVLAQLTPEQRVSFGT
ncbi:MAG: alpha/beta hydrolase, partial [Bdellovibrionota bacterium]